MIRMIQSSSAGHAKSYFSDALSKSDYYINDQELNGSFQGKLAQRLKLEGIATKEKFFALCENINPNTGTPLTQRTIENRTVGYDINFHCPKSVSILHALAKDEHIKQAFEKSVQETMQDIERDAKTRVRKKGKYEDRSTDELLWTDFVHQTARPVEDYSPDPHLHAHCFVFNVTWDQEEKQLKAGQFRDIKRDMPFYQARFHKRLSDQLMELGYSVKRTDKSFEVEGVPQRVIDLFSKRTDEIGRVAKEKGITNAKDLDQLGARTRSKKQKGHSMEELKAEWRKQIAELEPDKEEGKEPVRHAPQKENVRTSAKECLDHALKHSFERASVVADRRLLETAYRHGIGDNKISVEHITDELQKDISIIQVKEKTRNMLTTKSVLNEEKAMVQLARKGQGQVRPLFEKAPKINLEGQQHAAVEHVLTTSHRVSIIRGAAGSGKTTLMKEAVKQIEKTGMKVTVIAPTAQASRGVLKDEGFEEAETVAKFLQDRKLQDNIKNQVLWVDEAGLLGTRDMKNLLDVATNNNARIILGGDTRQHSSVVRGDALRILNTIAGIKTAEVSKIYRQKNKDYKEIVQDLSEGKIESAFSKLDDIGFIKSVDPLKPNETLIEDYMKAVKKGKSALVVSPTHKQGEAVTDELRKKMRGARLLGKKEVSVKRLSNCNLTDAQKEDSRNYKPGNVIQFNQNLPGIKRGSTWTIDDSKDGNVKIRNEENRQVTLPLDKIKSYDVFERSEIGLSKGDKVSITKNAIDNNKKRMNNGQELEVVSVSKKGQIVLRNAKNKTTYKVNRDFGHLSHAYCVTSHSSQGKTVDDVFISQPASTFTATNAKQFYVSVSRAKDRAHIYTDDKVGLLENASEIGDRQSAIELVAKKHSHEEFIRQAEIQKQQATPIVLPEKDIIQPYKPKDRDYEPGV